MEDVIITICIWVCVICIVLFIICTLSRGSGETETIAVLNYELNTLSTTTNAIVNAISMKKNGAKRHANAVEI